MSIYHPIKKIKTEIDFAIDSHKWNAGSCYIIVLIANYYKAHGSLGNFEYSIDLGTSWNNCTLLNNNIYTEFLTQISGIDKDGFGLSGNYRRLAFPWDAKTDLQCLWDYNNVMVRMTFFDEVSQGGSESDAVTYTIDRTYVAPNGIVELERPYPSDPVFDVVFYNLVAFDSVNCHFKVECDKVNTFDSGDYLYFESEADQTDWDVDGGAFPVAGVPSVTDKANRQIITFSSATLAALAEGNYYIRIIPTLHDPNGIKSPGVWDPDQMKFI